MSLARQEAQRFNHDYIGTEHILLGLVQESSGVAVKVLTSLDVDLTKIRQEVEKLVSTDTVMVTMGQLPFTPRAKRVLELSLEAAGDVHHTYIGTEHLLLGLIRESEGIAAQVLRNLEVKVEDVREEVLELLGTQPGEDPVLGRGPIPLPPSASHGNLLRRAADTARGLGATRVEPEHVLRALLRSDGGIALGLLKEAGVDVAAVRAAIERQLRTPPPVADGGSRGP